ncbi:MAG: hypothetical protein FJZ01_22900 [Candidatus Sericytochromatia bacterium]|nr:hypothetical protein [Candidatus Tanganyikabacteria bacterium]
MTFASLPAAPAIPWPRWAAVLGAAFLTACTALTPGITEIAVNPRLSPPPGVTPAERVEVRLEFRDGARRVQEVPTNWASIKVSLAHATLLSTSRTATINQNAGNTVPATGVVFSSLRPGSDYSVSVELYDAQNLGGNQLKKGIANPVTLNAGANTVTIGLTDPGAISGSVSTVFPTTFTTSGVSTSLAGPSGVVRDNSGNIFVADTSCRIFKKDATTGVVTVFAGTGTCATACNETTAPATDCDGTGTAAKLLKPQNMSLGADGNIYFNDGDGEDNTKKCLLRRSTPGGTIQTLMGSGGCGYSNATNFGGKFLKPTGLVVNTTSGTYYITDTGNQLIRQVTSGGSSSDFAGKKFQAGLLDDVGTAAKFSSPKGLTITNDNATLYVADSGNNAIRKVVVASTGVTTLAGSTAGAAGFTNGFGTAARFSNPTGLSLADDGNLYIADTDNHAIRKLILNPGSGQTLNEVITLAGNGSQGCNAGSGTGVALFKFPTQVFKGADGKLYVANTGCNSVSVIE